MSSYDVTGYIRGKIETRKHHSATKFMKDGFDRWAESTQPARVGQMEKIAAEETKQMSGGAHFSQLPLYSGLSGYGRHSAFSNLMAAGDGRRRKHRARKPAVDESTEHDLTMHYGAGPPMLFPPYTSDRVNMPFSIQYGEGRKHHAVHGGDGRMHHAHAHHAHAHYGGDGRVHHAHAHHAHHGMGDGRMSPVHYAMGDGRKHHAHHGGDGRKHRAPSAYALFVKEFSAKHPGLGRQLMSEAAAAWRSRK